MVLAVAAYSALALRSFGKTARGNAARRVLRVSAIHRAVAWLSVVLGIAMGAWVVATASGQNRAAGLGLAFGFLGGGTLLVLMATTRWEITTTGITRVGPWRRTGLDWRDVRVVTFSVFTKSFVLEGTSGRRLRVPLTLAGGGDFVRALRERLPPSVAADALRAYDDFLERVGLR